MDTIKDIMKMVEIKENPLTCPGCGGNKIGREKNELKMFAVCEDCGYSWNAFSNPLVFLISGDDMKERREIIEEHLSQIFSTENETHGQWLASFAKLMPSNQKNFLSKIGSAIFHGFADNNNARQIRWRYIMDLNQK